MNLKKRALMLGLKERKVGILESKKKYPESAEALSKHVNYLKLYQKSIGRSSVRICFYHEHDQDMLMLQSPRGYTPPLYQLHRHIQYNIIEGQMKLLLLDLSFNPNQIVILKEKEQVSISSNIPRSMIYGHSVVIFREIFSGDFKDEYTIWPFGKNGEKMPAEKLLNMFKV